MRSTIIGLLLVIGFTCSAQFNQKLSRQGISTFDKERSAAQAQLTWVRSTSSKKAISPIIKDRQRFEIQSGNSIINYYHNFKPPADYSVLLTLGYQLLNKNAIIPNYQATNPNVRYFHPN